MIQFHVQFGINLHKQVFPKAEIAWPTLTSAISAFCKTHKCILIPNWTRKTIWLLINDINVKKNLCGGSAGRSFLESFFHIWEKFASFCTNNFGHHFTCYHWLRKFPIIFQSIIIQNYQVWFALMLHFSHWCYAFRTGITLELHCSQPIRIKIFWCIIVIWITIVTCGGQDDWKKNISYWLGLNDHNRLSSTL